MKENNNFHEKTKQTLLRGEDISVTGELNVWELSAEEVEEALKIHQVNMEKLREESEKLDEIARATNKEELIEDIVSGRNQILNAGEEIEKELKRQGGRIKLLKIGEKKYQEEMTNLIRDLENKREMLEVEIEKKDKIGCEKICNEMKGIEEVLKKKEKVMKFLLEEQSGEAEDLGEKIRSGGSCRKVISIFNLLIKEIEETGEIKEETREEVRKVIEE